MTFYVPATAAEPVELKVAHSGLRMALVNRESLRLLGSDWRVLGIYFLIGPHESDPDRFRAYVGEVGRRDLLTRLSEHLSQKSWWSRALLITSDGADGFNSAEIGWLEGRFYDVLSNAVAAEVMNKGRPGDDSISIKDRGVLERYVDPVMAALRACGAPPDTADQKPLPAGKKRAHYRESVKDLIDAGLIKPDTRLMPLRRHLTTPAVVLPDGRLEVEGAMHSSVSSAAVAVSGNSSEPGWEFWGAPSGDGGFVPLFTLRERLRDDLGRADIAVAAGRSDGYDHASLAEPRGESSRIQPPARRRYEESVKDLIDAGLLSPGEELISVRVGRDHRATVLPDGTIGLGGAIFASLSGAAKVASGNTAEPGWEFWAVRRNGQRVRLFDLRELLRTKGGHHRDG